VPAPVEAATSEAPAPVVVDVASTTDVAIGGSIQELDSMDPGARDGLTASIGAPQVATPTEVSTLCAAEVSSTTLATTEAGITPDDEVFATSEANEQHDSALDLCRRAASCLGVLPGQPLPADLDPFWDEASAMARARVVLKPLRMALDPMPASSRTSTFRINLAACYRGPDDE